jgi:nucleotide-binding universal stress UspA family protein
MAEPAYNGSVYLVVADETEEFSVALHYAAKLAQANGARTSILYVMDDEGFQHWGNVESRIRWEMRDAGEKVLLDAAQKIRDLGGGISSLHLAAGGRPQVVLDVINSDYNITKLILGGGTQSANPGPLVSYFTGKGLVSLRVPLTIVPGNISLENIDGLI